MTLATNVIPAVTPVRKTRSLLKIGFLLTLPAQILILFISVFPMGMQVYLSLTDWSPLSGMPWTKAHTLWTGLDNFSAALSDPRLGMALVRTFVVIIFAVPAEFLAGLGLALLFVGNFRMKKPLYSVILIPMMVVPAVAGYMFFLLFQSDGPINGLLAMVLGRDMAISWLSDPILAMVAVIISDIWQWTPLMFLILLAGLSGVPEEQIKAATLLGASPWQRFYTIVLPRLRKIIIIALAIRVIEVFKIFDTLYIMTSGGPGVATETISVYIYKVTTNDLAWSYVAAVALLILIALTLVVLFGLLRFPKSGAEARK